MKHIQDTVEIQKMLAVITKIRLDINYYIFGNLVSNSLFILVFEDKSVTMCSSTWLWTLVSAAISGLRHHVQQSVQNYLIKNVEWILELTSHVTLSEFPLFAKDTGKIKPRWLKT